MSATRIALVGAGRMGAVHLAVLRTLPGIEVCAVVDPVAPGATHRDVVELLADAPPDGAVVAAPSTLHVEIVGELLSAGIPTLCEKPCGTSAAEAGAALEQAAATATPLQIGYWRRFVRPLQRLRERIAAGELGEIVLVRCEQWDERPPAATFRRASGGILVDMGVHELDQIRWLTGQELECRAAVAAVVGFDPPVEGDPESVEATFALSGGGLASVSLGRRHPPGDVCRVVVHGTEGVADCVFVAPPDSDAQFREGIAAQDAAFVDRVRGGAAAGAGAEDALAALRAAEAAASLLAS